MNTASSIQSQNDNSNFILKPINGAVSNALENALKGFILLYRSIRKHWLWKDSNKFQWWIDILLEVNHKPGKVSIGYELISCERGQSLHSLREWSLRWRVDVSTVRRFLKLLEDDGMIVTENIRKTTRLTVCNYDAYNTLQQAKQTQNNLEAIAKQTRRNTNNNDNNDNNDNNNISKKESFYNDLMVFKSNYDEDLLNEFFNYWSEFNHTGKKMKWELQKTFQIENRLRTWFNNSKKFTNSTKNKNGAISNEPATGFGEPL